MGCGSSRTHPHQAQGRRIQLLTPCHTSMQLWMVTPIWSTPNWGKMLAPTAISWRGSANPMDTIARSPSIPSHAGDLRKRRRTRTMSPKRALAPTARNFIAGSPTAPTQSSACGTSTRATASSQYAMRLKWCSNHATIFDKISWVCKEGGFRERLTLCEA
jgi:hypothetical protein